MKTIISTIFVALSVIGWSQTKVTVSDGNWNDPSIWNPVGIPVGNEDSIIINHEVDVLSDLAISVPHLIIESNGILYADNSFSLGGSLKVNGEIIADSLTIGNGAYFINNGLVEADQFTISNLMNENNADMDLLGVFIVVEPFLNSTTGVIEALDLLTTSDGDMENNGVVFTDSWTNEGTVLGSGSFCIEECFQNVGAINGTLDVCDVTPNSGLPCDLNVGTLAPTVTLCTNGPCSGAASLDQTTVAIDVNVFPNPTRNGLITVSSEIPLESIKVIDLMGRNMIEKTEGDFTFIDLSTLKSGDYLLVLQTGNRSITKRITTIN